MARVYLFSLQSISSDEVSKAQMNLAVVTACLYRDRKPIHYLDRSCEKQGIFLIPHGIGSTFSGWANALIRETLPAIADLHKEGYSHALFTDGSDSIVIAPQSEIIEKYKLRGSPPCLMSADSECFPAMNGPNFKGPEPWRYVNGGGYICEIPYFVRMMTGFAMRHGDDGNHQGWIVKEWPVEGMLLDHNCCIFQPMDNNPALAVVGHRLVNNVTHEWPCVLHFRGGYSDPLTGRDERIEPVWRQLYGS